MRRVIIESPYAGCVPENRAYLDRCIRDSIKHNEAPFASHKMYTDALDDNNVDERAAGMDAGFAWNSFAAATVVYCDRGISNGMMEGIWDAIRAGRPVEFRLLDNWDPV